ncbi:hypothetical protein BDZ89DRAFT_1078339 [Hymenopellis radicata]|nr:hypothetical protein BDZ89DRAFT_1078339 [Hymenopellis radicata]
MSQAGPPQTRTLRKRSAPTEENGSEPLAQLDLNQLPKKQRTGKKATNATQAKKQMEEMAAMAAKLADMEARLQQSEAANKDLQATNKDLRAVIETEPDDEDATATAALGKNSETQNENGNGNDMFDDDDDEEYDENMNKDKDDVDDAPEEGEGEPDTNAPRTLEEALARIKELEEQQQSAPVATSANATSASTIILRPKGTAGTKWSIQEKMGLGKDKYKSIQRTLKDVVHEAHMPWQLEWSKIPPQKKVDLFSLARVRIPHLARYENDWATEVLVRQYMKNRRGDARKKGTLDAADPAKYGHLKANSLRRSSTGSRTPRTRERQ